MVDKSDKSKSASEKTDPKAVRDSITPILHDTNGVPLNKLGEDLVNQANILAASEHNCGPAELGEFIEEEHVSSPNYKGRRDGENLGGKSATIAFDDSYFWFFTKFSPAMRHMVLNMGAIFTGEAGNKRFAKLIEMVDERVEQEASSRRWRRWRKQMWFLFAGAVVFARYFVDQASWVVEKLPLIKEAWRFLFNIKGGG